MAENLVNISEVIAHGIIFDPKNSERIRTMDFNQLLQSIPRLFDLLEERRVEYVLVGGIAMLVYVEGRNTQDIVLIITRNDLKKLPEFSVCEENVEFSRCLYEDLQVDFLYVKNKLFDTVRKDYSTMKPFADRMIPCANVEGLVLLKLFALPSLYRQARFDKVRTYQKDIADLIEKYRPDTAPLMKELAEHMLPSDIAELEKILQHIEDEIAQSQQRFRGNE